MPKENKLFISDDCKNPEGKDVLNAIHKHNEIHLLGVSTEVLKKVIDKGKNSIATLVLHSCYLNLKHLIKLKKLTTLVIVHDEDIKKLYGYKYPKLTTAYKKWFKKNKWMEKNLKKSLAFMNIVAYEMKHNVYEKDEDFLKEADKNLVNFPKYYNHKKYPVIQVNFNNVEHPFQFYGKDFMPLKGLKKLKHLSLYVNSDTDLTFIKKLHKLNELRLDFINQEDKYLLNLEKILPQTNNLSALAITGNSNYQLTNTNLQFLLKYKNLKKLRIEGYAERLEINPLHALKKIEVLNIDEYFDVSDIKGLLTFRKLEHIRKLRINKCDNLTVLCEYLKDTDINALVIFHLSNTKTLSPIKNLKYLASLAIFQCDELITDTSPLRFLQYLSFLRLDNIQLKDISLLKVNTKFLQILILTRSAIDKIQKLVDYKKLYWLSLSMYDKKYDFSFLHKLKVDTLHLTDIENLNFTESLPKLNSIKILRLEGSTSKAAESEAVTMDFKSRESLINEFFEHWKFNALSEENRIKALEYYGTQNIDFLNKFPNLTELMINNLSIKELKPLKNLRKLTDLTLWRIDNNIFDNIDKITNLKSLDLSRTNFLPDPQLLKIKKLKHLECLTLYHTSFWTNERRDKMINILKNKKLAIKSDDDHIKLGDVDHDRKAAFY